MINHGDTPQGKPWTLLVTASGGECDPQTIQGFERGLHLREVQVSPSRGTILYVHGLGESGQCFEPLMQNARLAPWSHLAPDLPGYGQSPDLPGGLAGHADHLSDCLRRHSAPPVVVLGHSMGGVVGLLLCERHPDQVAAFVNVEGNLTPSDCTFSARIATMGAEAFIAHGFNRLRQDLEQMAVLDPVLQGYHARMGQCDPRRLYADSLELVEYSKAGRLADRLAALCVPTLYISGYPRGIGEPTREILRVSGLAWQELPGAGHWVFLDQPRRFIDALKGFLVRL